MLGSRRVGIRAFPVIPIIPEGMELQFSEPWEVVCEELLYQVTEEWEIICPDCVYLTLEHTEYWES